MKVTIQKSNKCEKTLIVKVSGDQIQQEFENFFSSIADRAKIPGFRQGKVPRQVLETHFQKEAKEKVVENLISQSYREAIHEHEVQPVALPRIEAIEFSPAELSYKAIVETRPEMKLPRYTGLKATRNFQAISEKDVDDVIENLRQKQAQFIAVEDRSVQIGDFVVQDVHCTIDGKEVENRKDQWIEVGAKNVAQEFTNHVIALKVNEEKSFTLKLPENFHVEEHRNKEAEFTIRVKEIKTKKLPELDVEFLKTIGDFQSIDDLKNAIRTDLEENQKKQADRQIEHELIDEIVEKCRFDLPASLLEDRVQHLVQEELQKHSASGAVDEKQKEALRETVKKEAERQLRAAFILQEIGKKENLEITQQDVEERFEKIAKMYGQDVQKIKELYHKNENELDHLISEIQTTKVVQFIKDKAEIKDKVVTNPKKV